MKMNVRQAPSHVFLEEMVLNKHGIRSLCFIKQEKPIICVFTLQTQQQDVIFDARRLAGRTVYVKDTSLVPIVTALFASFYDKYNLPIIQTSKQHPYDAQAVICDNKTLKGQKTNVSIADFSKASQELFKSAYPSLEFATRWITDLLGYGEGTVTSLALDTIVYGPPDVSNPIALEKLLIKHGDLNRLRELEFRFKTILYPIAEEYAKRADKHFHKIESVMIEPVQSSYEYRTLVPNEPVGKLNNPRDPVTGSMTVSAQAVRQMNESGSNVREGHSVSFQIGSYPKRSWYVHHVDETGATFAPWMPVNMGRAVDRIGQNSEGRDVHAVRGDVTNRFTGRKVKDNVLVGDPNRGVFGVLYTTNNGSQAVLGSNPDGDPSSNPFIRNLAMMTRWGKNGRLDYMCHGYPEILSPNMCIENGGVWDRPCTQDHECPFFSSNARGGCINGYCEMPLGVTNKAFTEYEGVPICRNCKRGEPGKDPLRCCHEQTNPKYAWSR